ncbi:hypothetical protein GCM10011534_42400 [Pseudooceanicola nanhaiensis]|uniref:Tripartite tricarboxylate transporter family receptor n=1 Tax=Pseudooceanicola nanhaiensis TaxID=375761 RepID=A0A917WMW0_9RHOB|nr:hypothetical protein GCM10011534_42400 [Pseudooceanicola nanhaiensis]
MAPYIANGQVRALAIAARNRDALIPETPTMGDVGYPAVTATIWNGIFVPAGPPDDIRTRLETALIDTVRAEAVAEKMKGLGVTVLAEPGSALEQVVTEDAARWKKVIAATGIKAE